MWAAWKKEDPPPHRVKPVPVTIVSNIVSSAYASSNARARAIADMAVLAFFFLLRPGEYTSSTGDTTPFTFADVQLFAGARRLCLRTASAATVRSATFCTLTFTSQKNGVRGEVIGLARSGSPLVCPVHALVNRILHLRKHDAPPSSPLADFYINHKVHKMLPSHITAALRQGARSVGPSLGFLPQDVSARSLRAGGAMSLLCASVNTVVTKYSATYMFKRHLS